jgi:hypothetical protein
MQSRCKWIGSGYCMMVWLLCLPSAAASGQASGPGRLNVVTQYVDPKQQTALWFGARSHWLQPWRAYLDTVPTARLRQAAGINLNVEPDEADAVCRHLAKNGFCKVRIEFGWGSVSWDDPQKLADPARFEKVVIACRKYSLRPLFLLNAHSGAPCPVRFFNVRLTQPAKKGDRVVKLDPASTAGIVPGRSGLNNLSDYWAAEAIISRLDPDGAATLSKPLPKDLPAGEAPAATLQYLPFYPSKRKADGRVPPEFEETMAGWLDYVRAVTTEAKRVLGTEGRPDAGFDLEVWNELTFGSHFLSINDYYEKPPMEGEWAVSEILRRTVAWVNDPANGLPGVGVGDGFNNQWPWGAGSTAPPGLAALDKHPYAGVKRFPKDQGEPNGIRPLDALGRPDGTEAAPGKWLDSFIPTYVSHFPEYFLCAIQTEHLIRDLSPITTDLYNVKHGRNTRPAWPGGRSAPAPQMWITEVNLDPNGADPGDLAAYIAGRHKPVAPGLTPADADRMKAKAVLRYLTCYVNKGPVRFYFFAAKDDNPLGLNLVSRAFFDYLKAHRNAYPAGDALLTSPTMRAVRHLMAAMPGGINLKHPRALSLLQIAEDHGHFQFDGDPATAGQTPNPHPPLYNRECLAFLPFQSADNQFVIPIYVMTRNLARLYRPDAPATDPARFDMPAEVYRLTIGGIRGTGAKVSLYDPLNGTTIPVKTLGAGADRLIVEIALTDSPRLLTITESLTQRRKEVREGHVPRAR